MSELLPEPDGPNSATTSPCWISRSMPLRISTGAALLPSVRVSPRALIAGPEAAGDIGVEAAVEEGAGWLSAEPSSDPGVKELV